MGLEIPRTENIKPGGPSLKEVTDKLDSAQQLRSQHPFWCRVGFHKLAPGPTFETILSTEKVLWNLKICRYCFEYKKQIIATAEYREDGYGET